MNTVKARVGKGDFRARRAQAKHKQSVLTGDGWFFFLEAREHFGQLLENRYERRDLDS